MSLIPVKISTQCIRQKRRHDSRAADLHKADERIVGALRKNQLTRYLKATDVRKAADLLDWGNRVTQPSEIIESSLQSDWH